MRFGLCTDPANSEVAARLGYDYIEGNLSKIAAMEEQEFEELAKKAPTLPAPILKCNCFLPGTIKLVGPDANKEELEAYLEKAFSRASKLGVKVAVLGSGGARKVPEGWEFSDAWRQIADFLRLANQYGEKYDIDIALEPLRAKECNILNYVSEGVLLSAMVNLPRVYTLADTFHMICGCEPFAALKNAGKALRHVHISHPLDDQSGRDYPRPNDGVDYAGIFAILKEMGYEGDVSIEAATQDIEKDGEVSFALLKPMM